MNNAIVLQNNPRNHFAVIAGAGLPVTIRALGGTPGVAILAGAGLPRWMAWLRGGSSPTTQFHTHETAATLYARAAQYEATQPSFAADLRAAAEGLEENAAKRVR